MNKRKTEKNKWTNRQKYIKKQLLNRSINKQNHWPNGQLINKQTTECTTDRTNQRPTDRPNEQTTNKQQITEGMKRPKKSMTTNWQNKTTISWMNSWSTNKLLTKQKDKTNKQVSCWTTQQMTDRKTVRTNRRQNNGLSKPTAIIGRIHKCTLSVQTMSASRYKTVYQKH